MRLYNLYSNIILSKSINIYALILSYTSLYKFIQVYTSLYKFIQVYTSLYKFIQVYTSFCSAHDEHSLDHISGTGKELSFICL